MQEDGDNTLSDYYREIGRELCPFLEQSLKRNLLQTVYCKVPFCEENMELELFTRCYEETEIFRMRRREWGRPEWLLACTNIVVTELDERSAWNAVENVHWYLKCIFARKKIVFGKFHAGHAEKSKSGREIPISPESFISIRSLWDEWDQKFFSKAEWLWSEASSVTKDDLEIALPIEMTAMERFALAQEIGQGKLRKGNE